MIARIIEVCVHNRLLTALLTAVFVGAGIWSVRDVSVDAIPDLSDVQVIVTTEFPGQNPQVVDDQVTYPLASALLAVPGATVVRGFSMFEQSFVYVLFEDGTDIYWARSRVLEYLNFARDRLPRGVEPRLGPDASGVGWVYQYVLYPGFWCPEHPKGVWHDPDADRWYAEPQGAPKDRRDALVRVRGFETAGSCPLDGSPLQSANQDIAGLRSLQDWYLRNPLTAVAGVSEVASIGGFVRQYQVVLDPQKLQAFDLAEDAIKTAIERSNNDVGGSVIELAESEYMVRSRGYLRGLEDLGLVVVGLGADGTPIRLADVAHLQIAGEARRGIGELNGVGEAVGGIVVARHGENAWRVIDAVKARIHELEDGLPPGVFVKTTYDRSGLIERSVKTLVDTLLQEILVVGLICILFLLHARSELVAVFVVPASLLLALLAMRWLGINANIMSLGGLAIAIGVIVDSAVVMVENGHKHLDREAERVRSGLEPRPRATIILEAAQEVGPALFFSLLVITVAFLPVFVLGGEAGRLFHPLAFTKTFAMAAAAFLSITIIPVLMTWFITDRVLPRRFGFLGNTAITLAAMTLPALALYALAAQLPGLAPWKGWIALGMAVLAGMLLVPQRIIHEDRSPLSRLLQAAYEPFFRLAMGSKTTVVALTLLALASTWFPITRIGSEFMPALDEGDLLYMPTTDPSVSVTKAREILQQTDALLMRFPEVLSVHGKAGRAETATDPAPLSMLETTVRIEPDRSKWRTRRVERFFSGWPDWLASPLARIWPVRRPLTMDELRYGFTDPDGTTHPGLDQIVRLPGLANAWPHPVETRITMLATGIKTPVGVKILGPDLKTLEQLAEEVVRVVGSVPGTASAYAERALGGRYLDFDVDREAAARYGMNVGDVQDVIMTAVGGRNVTTTVEGLERYPLNLRYARELRDDLPALREVLVRTKTGAQVPLGQLATLSIRSGPPMIRSEDARPAAYVFIDVAGRDLGGYVKEAREAVARGVDVPTGYAIAFAGQYEFWEKTLPRLLGAGALALALIVFLLYLGSKSWLRVGIVLLAVPFSLIGAFWFLWALDYNMSLAVVVGIIALLGLDAETGMMMLLYLDNSFDRFASEGRLRTRADLLRAVHDGAVMRIRPKSMTVLTDIIGLAPLLWAVGTGADVMRRLAAPMIGGLTVSFAMELLVYPVLYFAVRSFQLRHRFAHANATE